MNGFVIYSMGDPEFMRLALLGLSHAFDQGAISLAKIGLMLGLLVVCWKGIWEPGKVEFKQFFIGFFLVFLLFVKQVNVTVVHSDGSADSMPPIPIGIALAGTIATNFGHSTANSLREFYHTTYVPGSVQTGDYLSMIGVKTSSGKIPNVAGNGLEPLRELMKLRFKGNADVLTSSRARSAAGVNPGNAISNPDLSQSLENYIQDCVLKDQYHHNNTEEVSEQGMKTASYAWPYMEVTYDGWATALKLTAGNGWETKSCGDAYTLLTTALSEDGQYLTENSSSVGGVADEVLVNSAVTMLGSVNTEAWHIKMNQILRYHYKKAKAKSRWASDAELMASQAEFEAMDKRRVSSATQYSLWSEMAIPLITFFESFVYLIGPLMPFVIAFGDKGMSMVSKYFFLLIWVNTWPILQVGVNLYLQNYINKASFATAPYDPFSWAGFNNTFTDLESFIAMGSTLQTMVPALSLMLLYGTSQAAVNLSQSASKAGGSEGSVATPKGAAASDSGKMTIGNQSASYDQPSNSSITGYSNAGSIANGMKSHNVGSSLQAASSAIQANAQESMHSASESIAASTGKMLSQMQGGMEQEGVAISASANSSEGVTRAANYAQQIQEGYGLSDEDSKTLGLALSGGLGAKAQAKAATSLGMSVWGVAKANLALSVEAGADAGIKAKLDNATKSAASVSKQASDTEGYQDMKQGQATLQNAVTKNSSSSSSRSNMFGKTGQEMNQAGETWSTANKTAKSEAATQQKTRAYSSSVMFNNSPVMSKASSNKIDEGFADGTLMTAAAVNSGYDSLKENGLVGKFNDFKESQAAKYANNNDGAAMAMNDFSKTSEAGDFKGNFKTSDQNSKEYMDFLMDDTKGDMTRDSVAASNGRYADKALSEVLSSTGANRYEAGADLLDEMNNRSGGNQAGWSTASRELRDIGGKIKGDNQHIADSKSDDIREIESNPNAQPKSLDGIRAENAGLKDDITSEIGGINSQVSGTDINAQHKNNTNKLNANDSYSPTDKFNNKKGDIQSEATSRTSGAGKVLDAASDLDSGRNAVLEAVAPHLSEVNDIVKSAAEYVGGTPGEKEAGKMSEATGINQSNAELISDGSKHGQIADLVGKGTSENATRQYKQNLVELMAAAEQAQPIIDQLNKSGSPEDKELAKQMQQDVNSANNRYMENRPELLSIAQNLQSTPGYEAAGERLGAMIANKDEQLGIDKVQGDDYVSPRSTSSGSSNQVASESSYVPPVSSPTPEPATLNNYTPSIDPSDPMGSVNELESKSAEINASLTEMIGNGQGGSEEYNSLREKGEEIQTFMLDNTEEIQRIKSN